MKDELELVRKFHARFCSLCQLPRIDRQVKVGSTIEQYYKLIDPSLGEKNKFQSTRKIFKDRWKEFATELASVANSNLINLMCLEVPKGNFIASMWISPIRYIRDYSIELDDCIIRLDVIGEKKGG